MAITYLEIEGARLDTKYIVFAKMSDNHIFVYEMNDVVAIQYCIIFYDAKHVS